MSKPRPVSLATATFLLVGVLALIGIGGLLGFDLLRASVRREPQRCFFASEAIWDICRTWLPAPSSTPSPSTGELDQTGYVKGIYVSHYALGSPELMARVKDLLENTELNAIVMDVKGDRGYVAYSTEVPLAKEIGADGQVMVKDWPEFMRLVQGSPCLHDRPDCHLQGQSAVCRAPGVGRSRFDDGPGLEGWRRAGLG